MGALPQQIGQREYSKFVPVAGSPNVSPIAVVNPDGTNLSITAKYVSTPTTYNSGDTTGLFTDVNGNLNVTLATLLAGEDLTNNLLKVGGNIAHGSADVGNPVKIGGIAIPQTAIVSTASGNRVNAWFDNQGRLGTFFQSGATVVLSSAATLFAVVNTSAAGQASVVLDTGTKFIGLATVVLASSPTLFAVVNTAAAGQASVVLDVGTKYVGLVTTTLHRGPILGAGDTNALFASTATGSMLNVALMGRTGNVASVDSSGNLSVVNAAGTNYIGLASVNGNVVVSQATAANLNMVAFGYDGATQRAISTDTSGRPILGAGANYVGLASVNIGGTLPALTAGTAYIGLASVNIGGNVNVVGNVAAAASDSGNPVKIGGKYNVTAPTLTDGQRGDAQVDVNSNLKVTLATLLSGEDITNGVFKVEQRFASAVISTAATTTIKTGAGFLHTMTVTGGTAGTIIGYDNTAGSGTKLFDFDSTAYPQTYIFDFSFSTGFTVVTGAATKISFSYR